MLKKKLLFIIPCLAVGGAERSLIILLKKLDYNLLEVDLMLLDRNRLHYLDEIPKEVHIVEENQILSIFYSQISNLLHFRYLVKHGKEFLTRSWLSIQSKMKRKLIQNVLFEYRWEDIQKFIPTNPVSYDVSIAYLEGDSIFYSLEKVKAKKHIGWLHTDYERFGFNMQHDLPYFEKLDTLFCVSNLVASRLVGLAPSLKGKVKVMYNLLENETILALGKENIVCYPGSSKVNIISVGNLRKEKRYDLSIKVCKLLIENGYKIKWWVAGEGYERKNIERLIQEEGMKDYFILLGNRDNPYSYISQADIFVQNSEYEGYSTTVTEAKILAKPIIATNIPGMRDQIIDYSEGLIVKLDPQDIFRGIKELIDNPDLRISIEHYLKTSTNLPDNNIEVFYTTLNLIK